MKKYFLKWSDIDRNNWQEFQISYLPFFSDENGYDNEHRLKINLLGVGESVDLSDGISQYHEVERLA